MPLDLVAETSPSLSFHIGKGGTVGVSLIKFIMITKWDNAYKVRVPCLAQYILNIVICIYCSFSSIHPEVVK